jgi:hypothetical protein
VCGKGAKISKGLSLKPSLFCDAFFPTEQQQGPLFFCSGKVSNNMLLVWQTHNSFAIAFGSGIWHLLHIFLSIFQEGLLLLLCNK